MSRQRSNLAERPLDRCLARYEHVSRLVAAAVDERGYVTVRLRERFRSAWAQLCFYATRDTRPDDELPPQAAALRRLLRR